MGSNVHSNPDTPGSSPASSSRLERLTRSVRRMLGLEGKKAADFAEVLAQEKQAIERARASKSRGAARQAAASAAGGGGTSSQTVVQAECETILRRREQHAGAELKRVSDAVGVAFSGGGIRSATFNLGVVQGIAGRRSLGAIDNGNAAPQPVHPYLTQIDYLSTVSGGGYIGSWLVGWIWRACRAQRGGAPQGCQEVERILRDNHQENRTGLRFLEPDPIRFLRRYSNYLAPRAGLVSTDTWALAGVYVRNVLLNLLLLIASGFLVLQLPLAAIAVISRWQDLPGYIYPAAAASVFVAIIAIAYSFASFSRTVDPAFPLARWVVKHPGWFVVAPCVVAAMSVTCAITALQTRLFLGVANLQLTEAPTTLWRSILTSILGDTGYAQALAWLHQHATGGRALFTAGVGAVVYFLAWWLADAIAAIAEAYGADQQRARNGNPRSPGVRILRYILLFFQVFLRHGGEGPEAIDSSRKWMLAARLVAGAIGGLLLWWVSLLLPVLQPAHYADAATLVVFGPPMLMLSFVVIAVIQVGILGIAFPDAKREWLARLGGLKSMVALGWLIVTGIAVYGPVVFAFLFQSAWGRSFWGRLVAGLMTGGWIGTTIAGLVGANRAPGKPNAAADTGWLLRLAPPVFILGLAFLLSAGVHQTLAAMSDYSPLSATAVEVPWRDLVNDADKAISAGEFVDRFSKLVRAAAPPTAVAAFDQVDAQHWNTAAGYLQSPTVLWTFFVFVLLIAILLAYRLDVNEFSIHLLYRNRLVRCYLGATRPPAERHPQVFTGFDVDDDIRLSELAMRDVASEAPSAAPVEPRPEPLFARVFSPVRWIKNAYEDVASRLQAVIGTGAPEPPVHYNGPYPLICTALNLVSGKELAWQKRKATSFLFSPLYCGYDWFNAGAEAPAWPLVEHAYRDTGSYMHSPGPYLGTAVAISGAAASPNMGYHSSPAVTFLMGVFDIRLGWWAGNPRHALTWDTCGPKWAWYLLKELFGRTDDEGRYVYLSDGGHFENLGLYELVRRRCSYIIVSDADCDADMTFSDLGNAIEKCRRDLNAEINIDLTPLHRVHDGRRSRAHFACGTIRYDDNTTGLLLYIKASLTGDEPQDVQAYAAEHEHFPHDSTAEQFFNESQFESYRALGETTFRAVVDAAETFRGHAVASGQVVPSLDTLPGLMQCLEYRRQAEAMAGRRHEVRMPAMPLGRIVFTYEEN